MDGERAKRYEEEYYNATRNCSRILNQLRQSNGVVDTIISVSVDFENEVGEADAYLKALDAECRTTMAGDKKALVNKVAGFKTELQSIQDDYKRVKFEQEAMALKNGSTVRTKLTQGNEKLDKSTRTLENSRMLVAQSEGIGNVILSDMENQREQLQDAHTKVEDTKQHTQNARQILIEMGRRAILHKFLVWLIIVILFGVIIVMIYFGFMKKK